VNGEAQASHTFRTGASPTAPAAAALESPRNGSTVLPFHPAFNGEVRFSSVPRPAGADDEAATAQTVAAMYEYSSADALDPIVRAAAAAATAGRHSQADQLAGIFDWVTRHVAYTDDADLAFFRPTPADAEVLIRPADLVRMETPKGDCDDYAMLARAMMLAAGLCSASIATVEADKEAPGAYSHVYLIAHTTPRATAFDAIPAAAVHGLGYEVSPTGKRRIWKEPMQKPATSNRPAAPPAHGRPAAPPAHGRPAAPPAYGRINRNGALVPEVLNPNRSRSRSVTPARIAGLGDDFDWNDWAKELTKDASGILGTRYGVPQVAPNQAYQRNADGSFMIAPANSGLSLGSGAGLSSGMLLLAGLGLAVVLIVNGRNK